MRRASRPVVVGSRSPAYDTLTVTLTLAPYATLKTARRDANGGTWHWTYVRVPSTTLESLSSSLSAPASGPTEMTAPVSAVKWHSQSSGYFESALRTSSERVERAPGDFHVSARGSNGVQRDGLRY